jgi:hypothetical protein
MIGSRIGPYEVHAKLGEGGMGEVYRARDARLNRDVAIKILPDAFAADADRVSRFTREAQTLAALNHPHIAQIYGIDDLLKMSAAQRQGGGGVYWRSADGSTDAVRLLDDSALTPLSWHPNGRLIAANRSRGGQNDIVLLSLDGNSRAGWRVSSETPLLSSQASESEPAFSPDGHWIAYQ